MPDGTGHKVNTCRKKRSDLVNLQNCSLNIYTNAKIMIRTVQKLAKTFHQKFTPGKINSEGQQIKIFNNMEGASLQLIVECSC